MNVVVSRGSHVHHAPHAARAHNDPVTKTSCAAQPTQFRGRVRPVIPREIAAEEVDCAR